MLILVVAFVSATFVFEILYFICSRVIELVSYYMLSRVTVKVENVKAQSKPH
jgi:hypothetical protein